jgi:hypothetical protein
VDSCSTHEVDGCLHVFVQIKSQTRVKFDRSRCPPTCVRPHVSFEQRGSVEGLVADAAWQQSPLPGPGSGGGYAGLRQIAL